MYNFKIIYYKGALNLINSPSKRPDYKDGFINIT
jgi:hypothetical protein